MSLSHESQFELQNKINGGNMKTTNKKEIKEIKKTNKIINKLNKKLKKRVKKFNLE